MKRPHRPDELIFIYLFSSLICRRATDSVPDGFIYSLSNVASHTFFLPKTTMWFVDSVFFLSFISTFSFHVANSAWDLLTNNIPLTQSTKSSTAQCGLTNRCGVKLRITCLGRDVF